MQVGWVFVQVEVENCLDYNHSNSLGVVPGNHN